MRSTYVPLQNCISNNFVRQTHIETDTLTVGVGEVLQSSTAEARSRQYSGWSMVAGGQKD